MGVAVVTPPEPFVSLDEAKAHLRVDHGDDDTLITAIIAAACGIIDGPSGWLGRAIGEQVLTYRVDSFSGCPVRLPYPPVLTLDEIGYVDTDGTDQTVDEEVYRLIGAGTDDVRVELAYSQSWPSIRSQGDAVSFTYTAGYDDVPAPIKAAALLMVGDLYANRETVVPGSIAAIPMSTTVQTLLAPYRVWL